MVWEGKKEKKKNPAFSDKREGYTQRTPALVFLVSCATTNQRASKTVAGKSRRSVRMSDDLAKVRKLRRAHTHTHHPLPRFVLLYRSRGGAGLLLLLPGRRRRPSCHETDEMGLCGDPIWVSTLSSHCKGPERCTSIQQGVEVTSWRWYSAPQPLTKLMRIVHIFVSS